MKVVPYRQRKPYTKAEMEKHEYGKRVGDHYRKIIVALKDENKQLKNELEEALSQLGDYKDRS